MNINSHFKKKEKKKKKMSKFKKFRIVFAYNCLHFCNSIYTLSDNLNVLVKFYMCILRLCYDILYS